jgi:hypothetical protein
MTRKRAVPRPVSHHRRSIYLLYEERFGFTALEKRCPPSRCPNIYVTGNVRIYFSFIAHNDSALESLHSLNVGSVVGILVVHFAPIFMGEVSRVGECSHTQIPYSLEYNLPRLNLKLHKAVRITGFLNVVPRPEF